MITTVSGLTTSQAARRLNLSAPRIRQMLAAGQLPCIQTGLGRLSPAEAIEELRKERERKRGGQASHERV
jgi:excisionase family DNA binding protein